MTEEKKVIKDTPVNSTNNQEKKDIQGVEEKSDMQQKTAPKVWYSGFWVRGAAHIIDGLVVFGIIMFIGLPLSIFASFFSMILGPFGFILQLLVSFLGLFIAWGYFIFMTHTYQATLGKMAVGIMVTAETGEKLTLTNVALRETIGKCVSGLVFGVGYIMIAFTDKKQGLHDMIVRSVVVYKDTQQGPNRGVVGVVYAVYGFLMVMVMTAVILMTVGIIALTIFGISTSDWETTSEYNHDRNEMHMDDFFQESYDDNFTKMQSLMTEL